MKIDLTGKRFGKLVVVERVKGGRWLCRCDCGQTRLILTGHLNVGNKRSCGCVPSNFKHGLARAGKQSPIYRVWSNMMDRCYRERSTYYADYGGRGITVCERWHDFVNFLEDMGERPEGKTLDRIDNDGNYEPGNCRWATPKEQANNRRKRRTMPPRNPRTGLFMKAS